MSPCSIWLTLGCRTPSASARSAWVSERRRRSSASRYARTSSSRRLRCFATAVSSSFAAERTSRQFFAISVVLRQSQVLVEPVVRDGHVVRVPGLPAPALVSGDEQDRLSPRIEREQHAHL